LSRTKDHYTCRECGVLDEEVPSNGGWCEQCGANHGWTFLAENSSEMGGHEDPIHECSYTGRTIRVHISLRDLEYITTCKATDSHEFYVTVRVVLTDDETFFMVAEMTGVRCWTNESFDFYGNMGWS
jgi:predicted ATP-dependent serine protease